MKNVSNPELISKVLANAPDSTNPKIQASIVLATWLQGAGAGASADVQALAQKARLDAINSPNPDKWIVALLAGLAIRGFAPLPGNVSDEYEVQTTELAATLVSGAATELIALPLSAGIWELEGNINFSATGATVTSLSGGITTGATIPTDNSEVYSGILSITATFVESIVLPRKRFTLSATTDVNLVCRSVFSAGSIEVHGTLTARRV